ncbi:hypothetical protein [Streptomyces roseochromogenus]|uniref:Chaplin domain-containing protein n=1 Tax=Streptomyces roseochromogenus subsp. oscitans DS 12.976 TaxID=1352936 RepID=V6K2H0_STRRC|nr:hypothetical protein [Streptomyces roseochromogenus]EST25606.1 hypothetical protein M878_28440 [Streptomyces roseochromogenus subsp. oscitans DS 12.976]
MHKLHKTAVLVAAIGSVGLLASGPAYAGGEGGGGGSSAMQSANCRSHDLNLDVIGELGILNGALGNAINGEGDPGAQSTHIGSTMGCNDSIG